VSTAEIGPDLSAVLTELAYHPADLGAAGEGVELADQGGALSPVQLRGEGGNDVLGHAEGGLAG